MKINRRGLFAGSIAAALGGQAVPLQVTFSARKGGVNLAHPDVIKALGIEIVNTPKVLARGGRGSLMLLDPSSNLLDARQMALCGLPPASVVRSFHTTQRAIERARAKFESGLMGREEALRRLSLGEFEPERAS